jgi:hypothetical protein
VDDATSKTLATFAEEETIWGPMCVSLSAADGMVLRQVVQGGGNMSADGKKPELRGDDALVEFFDTMRPAGLAPARDASPAAYVGATPWRIAAPGHAGSDCGGTYLIAGPVLATEDVAHRTTLHTPGDRRCNPLLW